MNLEMLMKKELSYNPVLKAAFRVEAMKALRALANAMELPKGSYDVRFNPGGIAVSGDAILHTENVYVHLSKFFSGREVYYRKCKGRKDCTGEANHWASVSELVDSAKMAEKIKALYLNP